MRDKERDFRKDKEDFLKTHQGRDEYDQEIARLNENRRRFGSYLKERSHGRKVVERGDGE